MLTIESVSRLIKEYADTLVDLPPSWIKKASNPFDKICSESILSIALAQSEPVRIIAVWSSISFSEWCHVVASMVEFPCDDANNLLIPHLFIFDRDKPIGVKPITPPAAILIASYLQRPDDLIELDIEKLFSD